MSGFYRPAPWTGPFNKECQIYILLICRTKKFALSLVGPDQMSQCDAKAALFAMSYFTGLDAYFGTNRLFH